MNMNYFQLHLVKKIWGQAKAYDFINQNQPSTNKKTSATEMYKMTFYPPSRGKGRAQVTSRDVIMSTPLFELE